jgi:hypothetical protein
MYQIANESTGRKRGLFSNTALKMGVRETIVEKDFWACFLLPTLVPRFIRHSGNTIRNRSVGSMDSLCR